MSKLTDKLGETRLDLIEVKEAVERATERVSNDNPGSARVHLRHAVFVLDRILGRIRDEETGPPPDDYNDPS